MRVLLTELGRLSSGDEAIRLAAVRGLRELGVAPTLAQREDHRPSLRRAGLRARVVRLPIDPPLHATSLHQLAAQLAAFDPPLHRLVRDEVRAHHAVAVAPGGRFIDGNNIPGRLATAAVALAEGVPLLTLHQSLGPISDPAHRSLVAEAYARSEVNVVRDDRSLAFARELGVPEARLVASRDVAFAESYPPPFPPDYELGLNIRCAPVRPLRAEAVCEFLERYLAARPGARVLVYTTTVPLRPDLVGRLARAGCRIESAYPVYPDYLRSVGRCAVHVSDSFHGIVFAMLADRPVVCCRPYWQLWKLEGTAVPGDPPLEIFPGLVDGHEARRLVERVLEVERDPEPLLRVGRRIAEHGGISARDGWRAVGRVLESLTERRVRRLPGPLAFTRFKLGRLLGRKRLGPRGATGGSPGPPETSG